MKKIHSISLAVIAIAILSLMSFTTLSTGYKSSYSVNTLKANWAKDSHDFGDIPQGKPVSVEFTFTNTGDQPLLIADVVSSCGCTAGNYSKEPVAPGKTSGIKVTYNAASAGVFTKAVTVNFQDAALKKTLTIKGSVK